MITPSLTFVQYNVLYMRIMKRVTSLGTKLPKLPILLTQNIHTNSNYIEYRREQGRQDRDDN
jgi:hypothetical protein